MTLAGVPIRTEDENNRARVAYQAAYVTIPFCVRGDVLRIKGRFDHSPDLAAIGYYRRAAKALMTEPNPDDLRQVCGHAGRFGGDCEFVVVEYPRFPAVDLFAVAATEPLPTFGSYVLAPYFSAIVDDRDAGEPQCFVLGQSPDGGTTLRSIVADVNANLGRGCEPDLVAFLSLLRHHLRRG